MTVNEEMQRLGSTSRPYEQMQSIIDACLVDNPGISQYDMCLGDYQYLLHKLRVTTYGPEYRSTSTCPYCGCRNEQTINLDDMEVFEYSEDVQKYFELDLPQTKKHIKLRMQTPRILDSIAERAKEIKKKQKDLKGDPAFSLTIQSLIAEVDGSVPSQLSLEEFVKSLPMGDCNCIMQYSEKLNERIGLDTDIECLCDICGLSYTSSFRVEPEFFRPSIDI